MNERYKKIAKQVPNWNIGNVYLGPYDNSLEQFADLLVRECSENLIKVWYEQGLDIRGAELSKFVERFNQLLVDSKYKT